MLKPLALINSLQSTPLLSRIGETLNFRYNDEPMSEQAYLANARWFRFIYENYFTIHHYGATDHLRRLALSEKLLVFSNHANTFEAFSLYYYFYREKLGMIRGMVFPACFQLPFFRELFRSGRALPMQVDAGAQALEQDHLLVFPEGINFVKRYLGGGSEFAFRSGFLRIARRFLQETGKSQVTLVPVAHVGFEKAFRFWISEQPTLVNKLIKPVFGFPYAIIPKLPLIFPTRAVFVWGKPQSISLKQIDREDKLEKWKLHFEDQTAKLYQEAKRLHASLDQAKG